MVAAARSLLLQLVLLHRPLVRRAPDLESVAADPVGPSPCLGAVDAGLLRAVDFSQEVFNVAKIRAKKK